MFVADIAHISGLVAAGAHPSPVPVADVVSTTTHKTLRGPRGGMILCTAAHAKAIDRAVFPGLQGGPHNHTTAGIAVALHEAKTEDFKKPTPHQIVANARALAAALVERASSVITGGTDNHLILADVTPRAPPASSPRRRSTSPGMELNYNSIPFDPASRSIRRAFGSAPRR
jgi:glycine hydroxymethyltransferase